MNSKINLNEVKSVLIISGPGIGDTFLFTPLVKAILNFNPEIKIDYLVRNGRGHYLKECQEINEVIEFDYKSTLLSYLKMVKKIFRKYDLAFATAGTDRFVLASFYASSKRIIALPEIGLNNLWKKVVATDFIEQDPNVPTSELAINFAKKVGLSPSHEFIFPSSKKIDFISSSHEYAVLHPLPMGWWKEWPIEHWIETVEYLLSKGLNVYLTGGPRENEIKYNKRIEKKFESYSEKNLKVVSLAGKTNFAGLCQIIKQSKIFVGIDTVASHLAGALGANSVVIFGTMNQVKWAPRPKNHKLQDCWFNSNYGEQTIKNVSICKANCSCPNVKTGCGMNSRKTTKCLKALRAELVVQAIEIQLNKAQEKIEDDVVFSPTQIMS